MRQHGTASIIVLTLIVHPLGGSIRHAALFEKTTHILTVISALPQFDEDARVLIIVSGRNTRHVTEHYSHESAFLSSPRRSFPYTSVIIPQWSGERHTIFGELLCFPPPRSYTISCK